MQISQISDRPSLSFDDQNHYQEKIAMLQVGLDRLGDWNPQLFRELKGRLKPRNLLLTIVISVGVQLVFLLYVWGQLPTLTSSHQYCTGVGSDHARRCLTNALGHILVDWPLWSLDAFITLSMIGMVMLPVVGTYLLVSDLDREERRGTLNFLRLTPQSAGGLLVGKMLGVPILLYWATLLAVPLHLWLGNAAGISLTAMFIFYGAVLASCVCFYSVALLIGLTGTWLGGFQAWLGSGGLLFLFVCSLSQRVNNSPGDLLRGLTPGLVLEQIMPMELLEKSLLYQERLQHLQWFHLPVGSSLFAALGFTLLNYGFYSFWAWQALGRRFRNANIPLFSKQQSYGLTLCFETLVLGLAVQTQKSLEQMPNEIVPAGQESASFQHFLHLLSQNLDFALLLNLVFFLGLIAALLPHRQAVQDWARYRHERVTSRKHFWSRALIADLLWNEKSPAVLAIANNLGIASIMLLLWVLSWPPVATRERAIAGLVLGFSVLAVYAVLAQVLLLLPSPKRGFWAFGSVSAAVVLPVLVFAILSLGPDKAAGLWLFSAVPFAAIHEATAHEIVLSWLGQLSIVSLLSLNLTRQVRQIGESASKALLSDRPLDRPHLSGRT
ncbi:ABC transporter permease [Trichocoleus sp. FACHB-591]|uniref:ABC transporter permease n=1 Tax=Trichocoleus sp. FACHB-591 TaxID=2692872 RepID=UPI001683EFEF|nr:ABC transporter permease [Trichocoleus sp. FACHB-591]MBD2098621.1 ABC transporter permease [Trichocoleus sp. FACHB-591]